MLSPRASRIVGQFDKDAIQARVYASQSSDAPRGSPRSLAAQEQLARDDKLTDPQAGFTCHSFPHRVSGIEDVWGIGGRSAKKGPVDVTTRL
jgi:hypothetical protein